MWELNIVLGPYLSVDNVLITMSTVLGYRPITKAITALGYSQHMDFGISSSEIDASQLPCAV